MFSIWVQGSGTVDPLSGAAWLGIDLGKGALPYDGYEESGLPVVAGSVVLIKSGAYRPFQMTMRTGCSLCSRWGRLRRAHWESSQVS